MLSLKKKKITKCLQIQWPIQTTPGNTGSGSASLKQFSTRDDDKYGDWAGFIAVGKDLNTLWLATKGSVQHGEADSAEIRLFYSRTIKPYIGAQLGWKRDLKPEPERDWLGFGLIGVLPTRLASMPVSLWVNPAAWRHGWK